MLLFPSALANVLIAENEPTFIIAMPLPSTSSSILRYHLGIVGFVYIKIARVLMSYSKL